MSRNLRQRLAGLVLLLTALATAADADQESPRKIGWADLRQQSSSFLPRQSFLDDLESHPSSSPLTGQTIRLSGYMLPVDREGDFVYAFLLTQVAGACIHTLTPPPDQLVLVTLKKPFKSTGVYQSVSVTGTIFADNEKVQLFMLDGVKVVEAGYNISSAFVLASDADTIR